METRYRDKLIPLAANELRSAETGYTEVSAVAALRTAAENFLYPWRASAMLQELSIFYRRLALLQRSGLGMVESLASLEQGCTPRMATMIRHLKSDAVEGRPLSATLSRYAAVIPETHRVMFEAAEASGSMDRLLDLLADYSERELNLRRFINRQTIYPKIQLVCAFVIIPTFFSFILGGNWVMALLRPLLMTAGILFFVGLGFLAVRSAMQRSIAARQFYEEFLWRLPGIGKLSRATAIARFFQALSALQSAGIGLVDSFSRAGSASGSYNVKLLADSCAANAASGYSAVPLLLQSGWFPVYAGEFLETGLVSGSLDKMVEQITVRMESDVEGKSLQIGFLLTNVLFFLTCIMIAYPILSMAPVVLSPLR